MRSAPCAKECLFADGGEHAWIAAKALHESIEAAKTKKKAPQNQTWVSKHVEFAEDLGVRWGVPVEASLNANEWFWNLTKSTKVVSSCRSANRVLQP